MAIRLVHGEDELTEVHDINVTPFIDVMLVLLIIFMVAAPLATVDVPVDLPSSNAHTTNLAVVAPGIAQALLATALGLVAAIPAVMIYNVLARSTAHYRAYLGDASAQVMRLVSRDLDRAKMPMPQAAE